MPILSASNRSQLAWKLEGIYPTNFGVPQAGNGTNLNMLSESLDYNVKNVQSQTIRADRQIPDVVQVGASAQGGFNFELQYKEFDEFLQGVMQNPYTVYGTLGQSATIASLTLAADTITAGAAPAGVDALTGIVGGQWFAVRPEAAASQEVRDYFAGRAFRTEALTPPTTTVINLDPATQINTAIAGVTLTNAKIFTSRTYNAAVMKSYTLEVGHQDIGQFRQYTGMIPSKVDMKLSVGSIITGTFEFMGKSFNLLQATGMGTPVVSQTYTPANAVRGVFDIFENGTSISATTFIKSAEISIDNSLRAQEAIGVFGNAGVAAGTIKATGKLEVYFADQTIYNKLLSGVATSLTIPLLDVDGYGYVLHFPRIKYMAAKVGTGGLDQDNMLAMDFMAVLDPVVTSPTYQKTIALYRV